MAHVVKPLIQWPWWRRCLHSTSPVSHLLRFRPVSPPAAANGPFFGFLSVANREVHFRSRALRLRDVPLPSEVNESDDESSDSGGERKSRNERKREARRAVRWGMELASFTPLQIKRILRVASLALDQEVYEAIMLVKRLGRDVREGKRRQFNYIGKLLREAEPELMERLIQATRDGDHSPFHNLAGAETLDDSDEEEEEEEILDECEDEDPRNMAIVSRWYDGLINKDISITNEIYSLQEVEYDRQELRQLVRKVQTTLEYDSSSENNGKRDAAAVKARRSLTWFLHSLVAQLPAEWVQ